MMHEASMHASKIKNLAHQAEKMIDLLGLTQDEKCHHPLPFRASLNVSRVTAEAATPSHLQIATEDWDILFRAIEERLSAIFADKPGAPIALLMDETAARNKVVVLECISAMEQLYTALKHERQSRQQL